MAFLGRIIPTWLWLAVVGALLALLGAQQLRVAGAHEDLAEARADLADYRATAAENVALALRAARAEGDRRDDNTRKAVDAAKTETATARADAARADTAADRLQRELAAFRARAVRASKDPGIAERGQGEPGADPLGVLIGLLERADRRAGIVERYADALRIAGSACERYADGLQPAPQ